MSIKITHETNDSLDITINNGDFRAINNIKKIWKIKDNESVLRFALSVLVVTGNGKLCALEKDGTKKAMYPAMELLDLQTNPVTKD